MKSLVLVISLLFISNIYAEDLTNVDEIVAAANNTAFYAADDGRAVTRMIIVDAQGRKQMRQFTIIRKDVPNSTNQKFLIQFSQPADVRNTVFMVHKMPESDDDRWLYLPSLDLVKRIAAGDKRTSFVGSHFYYEDVSGRGLSLDTHELVETTDEYYVIKNVPIDANLVEFSSYTVWVNKTNMMPVKTEYYDKENNLYRRIEALSIDVIDGYVSATKMKVSDLRTGAYTLNEMRFIKYNIGIPANVFTERSLRNPPRQYMKAR